MPRLRTKAEKEIPPLIHRRCDHALALVNDPMDRELKELEQMLANSPNCSRCSPDDGPIMAVVVSERSPHQEDTDGWSSFSMESDLGQILPSLSQPRSLLQSVLHNWK